MQAPLRACKSSSRDLAGINSTSLNILLDRVSYPSCKGAGVEKCQDLQIGGALQENALGQEFTLCLVGGSLSDGLVCVAKDFLP